LCTVYGVEGKISKYDMCFNNANVLDSSENLATLSEYSVQDSVALYNALIQAQLIYFNKYSVEE
jgi:hypothetical protein